MISTQQTQYILQLTETLNFSKAAEACFITQPTLSMQVKKAEDILGFKIFDRDKRPLALTSLGEQLIPVLREMNQANAAITQLSKKASGTFIEELNVGIIPTVSPYLIPLFYKEWKKELKNTRLFIKEAQTEELLDLLENKKLDLIIIAGPLSNTNKKISPLYTEELLAYTSKRKKRALQVSDLQEERPWLLSEGNCLRSQMMDFCHIEQSISAEWNFEGGNMDLLIKMVDMNGGYTLVPKFYQPLIKNVKGAFYSIKDSKGKLSPARKIIGVQNIRTTKSASIEKIVESISYSLNTSSNKHFSIVDWK